MKSTNFTPQDLIHLFIDGEASDAQQKALFEELAASDNLQAEFQQALDIKKSMAADFESMTPPPAVEASLFARAGFDPPADPPASDPDPAPAPVAAAKPGWFTKIGMPLLAAAAGSLATLILMLSLGDEPQAAVQAQTAPAPVVESYAADTPKIEENSDRNDYIYKDNSGRNIASANAMNQRGNRASAVRENISGADNSGIINENPENIDQNIFDKEIHTIDASIYVPAAADGDLAAGFTGRDFSPANSVAPYIPIPIGRDYGKSFYEMELRGISALGFFPNREMQSTDKMVFNNLVLALKYKLGGGHSLGLIGGRESFQMYRVDVIDGEYLFSPEPVLEWLGGVYRFTYDGLFDQFAPFGEVVAAGSRSGLIGRAALGVTYNPTGMLSFSAGVEGTTLMYKLQNELKTTGKAGMFYGMSIHF